jgi:DNA-directed RNA polymerase subunit H (RpoH/RPB5)
MKAENNDFYTLYQNIDSQVGFNNYDILGTKGDKRLLLKFTLDKEVVNRQDIITFRNNVNDTYGEDTNIIYVVKVKPNTFVYKEIKENDEIFLMSELIFNRTKHRLVPKHVLLTETEKREILTTYDCRDTQIPRMVTTDYVARYFGAKAGDMFKIYRPSPSSGMYITYRVVK